MALKIHRQHCPLHINSRIATPTSLLSSSLSIPSTNTSSFKILRKSSDIAIRRIRRRTHAAGGVVSASLDLTEDNVRQVLQDARAEFGQIFDTSVGMTGKAELAEVDGPFVKIRLSGRFWHERSLVIARLGTYLKQKIPEILEVDIEDEKQLDDSPANF